MAVDVFQGFTNPITGESFRCLSFDERAYVMEWTVQPVGYVPFEHIHLRQDEVFHVQQGEVQLIVDGKEAIARAGETATVPKGSRHVAFNNKDEVLKCVVEYVPGLDMLKLYQCMGGLTIDKDFDARGG
jgi:mannose-6-phosphate isomerase-like protein (cupin superfamily)